MKTTFARKALHVVGILAVAAGVGMAAARPAAAITQTYCNYTYGGTNCTTYPGYTPPAYYQPPTYFQPPRQTYCNYTYNGYNCTTY